MAEYVFEAGDRVAFKTWEELKEEFGVDGDSLIPCNKYFSSEMDSQISREDVYTINEIRSDGTVLFVEDLPLFSYSTDMIKPYTGESDSKRLIKMWKGFSLERDDFNYGCINVNTRFHTNNMRRLFSSIFLKHNIENGVGKLTYVSMEACNYTNPSRVVFDHFKSFCREDKVMIPILYFPSDEYEARKRGYANLCSEVELEQVAETEDCLYLFSKENNLLICVTKAEVLFESDWLLTFLRVIFDNFDINIEEEFKEMLISGEHEKAVAWIKDYANSLDEVIRRKKFDKFKIDIRNFEEEARKDIIEGKENSARDAVRDLEEELKQARLRLLEAQKEAMYYKYCSSGTPDDFITALEQNYENIVLYQLKRDNGYIRMHMLQPLIFFDDDNWSIIREGFLQRAGHYGVRGLVDAIFSRRVELMLETGFEIRVYDRRVRKYNVGNYTKGIPNPHIYNYDCWGDNATPITQALVEGKLDIALAQIKSAFAGINVTDDPVMIRFVEQLVNDGFKSIECITDMKTGEVMTLGKAIDYYKNYDATKEVE